MSWALRPRRCGIRALPRSAASGATGARVAARPGSGRALVSVASSCCVGSRTLLEWGKGHGRPIVSADPGSCQRDTPSCVSLPFPLHSRRLNGAPASPMQTWKIKRNHGAQRPASRGGHPRVATALLLILTLAGATYDFPALWNGSASFVEGKTGWSLPSLPEDPYRLGLDLQGGTHLVYEADMAEIPAGDQDTALEGVRDVIERRVNAFGVAEPVVQTITAGGIHRLIVELAGVLDVNAAIEQIGETPVLEFKEPATDVGRELTAEEKAALAALNAQERAAAEALLSRARAGAAFDALVAEASVEPGADETKGVLGGAVADSARYGEIVKAIQRSGVRAGGIVPKVIETPEGLSVVKYLGQKQDREMQLSHILFCFEGKTGCVKDVPALDASVRMTALRKDLTAENFAEKATELSDDPSAAQNGGDLGWVKPGDTVLAFELAARQVEKGKISEAVETDFGYHLIYKRDERAIATYQVQRVLLKLSKDADVVPDASPWKNTGLSGKHLERANVAFDPTSGAPHISLQFNSEGAELFGTLTQAHVGEPIAIFLDGEAISVPTVQQAIYGGQAVISGTFTLPEAKLLAQRLNAGALPVPVKLLSQETVGPSLGAASLAASVNAALIGFALVAAFMILVYRLPGLLAGVALVLYAVLNLAAYKLFGVTVTLSGIAGFVLSLGIAVDANVLIFERMRDEWRAGRDLSSSISEGYRRAWAPIRDGHLTTLISALVLYFFSSSFVKGFALTLGIGVALSLFTALTVTHAYLGAARSARFLTAPWLYSLKRPTTDPK
ncbi:protein translocase subunit SecD [Patescibacteria group bacterium]|nr:MAG: protein translocase subunit SecD [Patescibacteria group bacterium]